MTKKRAPAEEITRLIGERIKTSNALDGDCRGCRPPAPRQAHPHDYPGANWICDTLDATNPGCTGVVVVIVNGVRDEYDCSDW